MLVKLLLVKLLLVKLISSKERKRENVFKEKGGVNNIFFVDAVKKGEKLKNQKQINKRIKSKMSKLLSKF